MAVDFRATQAEFAAYIRDPNRNPAPADVAPERMAMYRELFFNNIDSFLATSFPVLRSLFTEQQWQALAADFFARHRCQTPYFSEIAEEFLEYLQQGQSVSELPFLWELAHYEWVELALAIAKQQPAFATEQTLLAAGSFRLAVSPLAWLLAYRFPVQKISAQFMPETAPEQPTYLVVYRDPSFDVHFMETVPLSFRLLQILEATPQTLQSLIAQLVNEIPGASFDSLFPHAQITMQEMVQRGIVIPFTD